MKRLRIIHFTSIWLVAFFLVTYLAGCSESGDNWETRFPTDQDTSAVQFGEPFDNVPATEDIVMYEVNIGAFSSSGNLNGVTQRLDSIKDLGINMVWLMPIYEQGELRGVGSPYAVRNYKKVNPAFGTLEDLRSLVEKAHSLDMAVILDWVVNHTSWDNDWISNKDWYVQDDEGNIIHPPGTNWEDVAELDYSSTEMRDEMIDAMKYWILEANVDGYRCDYAHGAPTDFWEDAILTLRAIPERDISMFAESDKKNLFDAGFDMIFGWNYYGKLKDVFNNNHPASDLFTTNSSDYSGIADGKHFVRWITNHDDHAWDNSPIEIFHNSDGSLAAFILTAYVSGVPLIYSGQEVGLTEKLGFFTGSGSKIDWSNNYSMRNEYKAILSVYNANEALRSGSLASYSSNDVAVFARSLAEDEVLLLVNIRDENTTYEFPAELENTSWTNAFNDSAVNFEEFISLEPYEYLVLKR